MYRLRSLVLAGVVAIAVPAAISAQTRWGLPTYDPGYSVGYERGQRAGADDFRHGDRFQYADESDYRKADYGYRSDYGSRDLYRDSFRRGFEQGYRVGYGNYGYGTSRGYGVPPYSNVPGYSAGRYDNAYQIGLNDGYEAGVNDADGHRAFDPISERRYRSADHGYQKSYGPKEAYKNSYRNAFRQGYERGYQDARRYETGTGSGRYSRFGF